MDRVGGDFGSYQALCEDERAYEDVLIVMEAEHRAEFEREHEAKHAASLNGTGR